MPFGGRLDFADLVSAVFSGRLRRYGKALREMKAVRIRRKTVLKVDYSADFSEDSIPDPMEGSSEDADDTGLCGQRDGDP